VLALADVLRLPDDLRTYAITGNKTDNREEGDFRRYHCPCLDNTVRRSLNFKHAAPWMEGQRRSCEQKVFTML
jgi:hypothetical protein